MGVEFDRNMFSEQNGTIIGFTIIVKEVSGNYHRLPKPRRVGNQLYGSGIYLHVYDY